MTKDEAILLNDLVISNAKYKRGDNSREWHGKRCAMCAHEILAGQEYLSFIPGTYRDRRKVMTDLLHTFCLDLRDRSSYPINRKVACEKGFTPLLTNDMIYDIISEKENDDDN